MANEKLVTLAQLSIVKNYVDEKDAVSIKSGKYADNKISLYTSADKTGTAAIELDLPEEMMLDQAKTTLVDNFAWSAETYPGSTDPELNGKHVLVLAVKGDTSVNYSFIALDSIVKPYTGGATDTTNNTVTDGVVKTDVKISEVAGNALKIKPDGLFVEPFDPATGITYATDAEVEALFGNTTPSEADSEG